MFAMANAGPESVRTERSAGDDEQGLRSRQCGRCRQFFAGDPEEHPTREPEWWLCPPCKESLLGVTPLKTRMADTTQRRT